MKSLLILLLFVGVIASAYAQQRDSTFVILPTDTLTIRSIQRADSITTAFQSRADSLNSLYQSQFSKIDSAKSKVQSKIDSLTKLNLPTIDLTKKLDSLNQARSEKTAALTSKIDDLKSKATTGLKEVQLPPQMQEPLDNLKQSITGYPVPALGDTPNPNMPSGSLPLLGNTELPGISGNLDLGKFGEGMGKFSDITGKAGEYSQDLQNVAKGNLDDVKSVNKLAEERLSKVEGMEQIGAGTDALGQSGIPTDSAALQNMAKEQLVNAAQDHFAGKQQVLRQAMDKMSKLKGRYSEVKSMADLPKRLPNALKGKPLRERIVPGLQLQMQQSEHFLLDVNPTLKYRITPRLSAGAGWNHRLPISHWRVLHKERIYGPRAVIEFKWTKGINFRLLPEWMYTTIPPYVAQSQGIKDPTYRTWVNSTFFGIKKDFTVYRWIKGNTEALYNLYDKKNMSPYAERLVVRFGFEFDLKKRAKKSKKEKEKADKGKP